jgi:hypothetical protein
VLETVFSKEVRYEEDKWSKNSGSCKGTAIQRGLEHESRATAIVDAVARQLLMKTLRAGKDLVCDL